MGLEKEIELIFRRVVELDLERVSRSAEPSYHWTTTPAPGMFSYPTPGPGSVTFTPRDYQVVRIELNPFGIDDAGLTGNMDKIEERLEKRKKKLKHPEKKKLEDLYNDFKDHKGAGDKDLAYHEYLHVSQAQPPISIIPRHIDDSGAQPKATIICVAGVDYVHEDYLQRYAPVGASPGYQDIENKVSVYPHPHVDQWPEEVVIRRPGAGAGKDVYVRADVFWWEPGEIARDKRFSP